LPILYKIFADLAAEGGLSESLGGVREADFCPLAEGEWAVSQRQDFLDRKF